MNTLIDYTTSGAPSPKGLILLLVVLGGMYLVAKGRKAISAEPPPASPSREPSPPGTP